MKILITGAGGFIGKNLVATLQTIGKHEILEYHHTMGAELLERFCRECNFVFHLAGVNRPKNPDVFTNGNEHFTAKLGCVGKIEQTKKHKQFSDKISLKVEECLCQTYFIT